MEQLNKPNLNKPAFEIFPEAAERIENNKCATCNGEVGEFSDELSKKEYSISGMCQKCQDGVFGSN